MKCVVVDMRNRLFGDAISGSLQHFDSGFRVYQTEGTAAEDLCVDTHADVLVAEVTAYPPWRLEQRLDLCRRKPRKGKTPQNLRSTSRMKTLRRP